MYALLKMEIGEKDVLIDEQSHKFADESLVDSQLEDGLSDNKAISDEEDEIKEIK